MRIDSHVHVVGPTERYPQAEPRSWTAAEASLELLQTTAAARQVDRFVVVQPSFYGRDNELLLDTLAALGANGRGVAVIDPTAVHDDDLAHLRDAGVSGLRVNLYSASAIAQGGGLDLDEIFAATVPIARSQEWHIEVIAPIEVLNRAAPVIARCDVPVVIDHYGLFGDTHPDDAFGLGLLELCKLKHVWIKLSAPYRSSWSPLETRPNPAWIYELLLVASERCVWGSDWPHTPEREQQVTSAERLPYRPLAYVDLFDSFVNQIGDPALAERILVDNPTALYGF